MSKYICPLVYGVIVLVHEELLLPTYAPESRITLLLKVAVDATLNVPLTSRVLVGLAFPIPTLPLTLTCNSDVPVEEEMSNKSELPAAPCKVKVEDVEVVPTDNLRLELSQLNSWLASKAPAAPANWMLPGVPE